MAEMSFSYSEAHRLVTRFIRDSGFREFCRNTCRGCCCINAECGLTEAACEEVPLLCAAIVCENLRWAIAGADHHCTMMKKLSAHVYRYAGSHWLTGYFKPEVFERMKQLRYPVSIFLPLLQVDRAETRKRLIAMAGLFKEIAKKKRAVQKVRRERKVGRG